MSANGRNLQVAVVPDISHSLQLTPNGWPSGWRCRGPGGGPRMPRSGLRVELEGAQFLVASASPGDSCGPRDRLVTRRQLEHGEAAVQLGRPRIATLGDRAVG